MIAGRPLRVAITALGCKVNYAEMADLAGALAAAGIDVVAGDEPADAHVLNSCTVTLQADATTRQRLARLRRHHPRSHLVLTGCSVDANPQRYLGSTGGPEHTDGVDAVFSNADKPRIADHLIALADKRRRPPADVSERPRWARSRAFLKVQDGCDHRCTYCSVWRARGGRSVSSPLRDVVVRAEAALANGYNELVLTGVDLGAYGCDLTPRTRLADLVESLLSLCGNARIRLSSVNANDIDERLAALTAHPRLCSHWHIPLQSGSDAILRAMHRGYRNAQYRRVARWLRDADPDTELTSDVMVAFPGESESDHQATLALVHELEMLQCHVFRYSPRPQTPAAELGGRVDDAVARRRSSQVRATAVRSGLRRRQRMVGRSVEVVWENAEDGSARGLSAGYHTVVATGVAPPPGAMSQVSITAVEGDYLRAMLPGL